MKHVTGWAQERRQKRTLPEFPKPQCRVVLVCGPPAAGKSTYVARNLRPGDVVIDYDSIAREMGYGRARPESSVAAILSERNRRLAALTTKTSGTAWVIVGAPSDALRAWWQDALNADDVVVLTEPIEVLKQRVNADPERRAISAEQISAISRWFKEESSNQLD